MKYIKVKCRDCKKTIKIKKDIYDIYDGGLTGSKGCNIFICPECSAKIKWVVGPLKDGMR